MDSKNIVVIGTLATKGEQIGFLKDHIAQEGHKAIVFDLSMGGTPLFGADITPQEIAQAGGKDIEEIKFCNLKTIYDFLKKVNLTNIRIMKQSLYLLNHFSFIRTYTLDDKVINEFVEIALNLFIFKVKSNYTYLDFQNMEEYFYFRSYIAHSISFLLLRVNFSSVWSIASLS